MKCPCEECITLAICYQKNLLECKDLYCYLCIIEKDVPRNSAFRGYHEGSGNMIYKIFNRRIEKTNILKYSIKLTNNEDLMINSIYM